MAIKRIALAASALAWLSMGSPGRAQSQDAGIAPGATSAWIQTLLLQREAADRTERSLQQLREDFARDEIRRRQRAAELEAKGHLSGQEIGRASLAGEGARGGRTLSFDTTPELQRASKRRRAESAVRIAEQGLRSEQIFFDQALRYERKRFVRRTESVIQRDALHGSPAGARRELRGYQAKQSLQDHLRSVDRFVHGE